MSSTKEIRFRPNIAKTGGMKTRLGYCSVFSTKKTILMNIEFALSFEERLLASFCSKIQPLVICNKNNIMLYGLSTRKQNDVETHFYTFQLTLHDSIKPKFETAQKQ